MDEESCLKSLAKCEKICFLCLETATDTINLFDTIDGLNVSSVISKYFWFKPEKSDENANDGICLVCYQMIKSFHEFYNKIKETHQNLSSQIDNNNDIIYETEIDIKDYSPSNDNITFEDYNYENDLDESPKKSPVLRRSKRNTIKVVQAKKSTTKNGKTDHTSAVKTDCDIIQSENVDESSLFEDKSDEIISEETKTIVNVKTRQSDAVDDKISTFMELTCDICKEIHSTLAQLKSHFRVVHQQKGYAKCCNKKFFKRYLLIDHIDTHLNPEHFKCKECNKVFGYADGLKRHVQELHKDEKCFYFCDQCPKKFIRQKILQRHKITHNPIETWTFICNECGKAFPSKSYLKSHTSFSHGTIPRKICHICGCSVQSNRYNKHLMEHDGAVEPKIQCEICGAWLKKKYMATHKINHQEAEIVHSCTICGKISPNRRALYIHMRYTHAEQRNHECTFCEKTFKRRLALKQHMAIHTGDNLYKCPYCPKTFTYDSNFHSHKKKEHPKEHEEERKRVQRTDFVKCSLKSTT